MAIRVRGEHEKLAKRISDRTGLDYEECVDVVSAYWRMVKENCSRFHNEGVDPRKPYSGIFLKGVGTFSAYPGQFDPKAVKRKAYDKSKKS